MLSSPRIGLVNEFDNAAAIRVSTTADPRMIARLVVACCSNGRKLEYEANGSIPRDSGNTFAATARRYSVSFADMPTLSGDPS